MKPSRAAASPALCGLAVASDTSVTQAWQKMKQERVFLAPDVDQALLKLLPGAQLATDGRRFNTALTKFWEALRSSNYDSATRLLRLPGGIYFLAERIHGNVVYVRETYDMLTNLALGLTPPDLTVDPGLLAPGEACNQLLVTGTPGTGKTVWQFALMKHLADRQFNVVVDWESRTDRILFTRDGAYTGSKSAFEDELREASTYFLVDSQIPKLAEAITIETSSPRHEKIWEFRKRGAVEKIMPPWPKPELQRALPIFPGVSMQLLSARYAKWGGSIRWCLAQALDPGNEKALEAGIAATNLAALQAAVGHPEKAENVSDRTLHMIPDDDLNRSHLAFASPYVEERAIHQLLSSARTALESFLVSSLDISELAVLRGRLFEAFVHRILPLGGTFDIRNLETGVSSQLVLPAVGRHQFASLAEVNQQPDGVHCFPRKKNLQSVDFLRQPDDMGQVTIDLDHGAKAAGLRAAHNVLRAGQNGQAVHLTFVVPSDRYDNFPKQKIGKVDRKRYPISQRVLKNSLSGLDNMQGKGRPVEAIYSTRRTEEMLNCM
ncbi:hypothetical protein WJX72_012256 [[Myrmecia] bisecta]|uniref:Uncharacterized protein n=1 Tax=[Myrmecia] bisecta TaxID=41462 RepID=A0AAW1PB75_9CHLO